MRPKFRLTEEIVNDVLEAITEKGIFVDAQSLDNELPDPKDRVFYEVVMEERKDEDAYLVTGNIKHFPVKPFIVTPRKCWILFCPIQKIIIEYTTVNPCVNQ